MVTELKKLAEKTQNFWLATDEDREGEAIAWHLAEVLKLGSNNTKRIVFDEITKDAILYAVANPRQIDKNLVDAQQARRILDRLVGFELSPILWKKVKPSLSAGRVQSVAVRLLVDREREIQDFKGISAFKVSALFNVPNKEKKKLHLKAELPKRLKERQEVLDFLEKCKNAEFTIKDIVTKPSKKSPAPPFTTSTLQQEASRKLGFSVAQTMKVAQNLYEAGNITYMRTDSVHLSNLAINSTKAEITKEYGAEYSTPRQFKTKIKGAQEAHEAIRPTYIDKHQIGGTPQEKKLYDLIWKRTIASQMSDAKLEKTTVTIDISTSEEDFIARGEIIKFDGFLKVYTESMDIDDEGENGAGLLPPIKTGDQLDAQNIDAVEHFSTRPPRYTEASLVKKLEEMGIGRPSTYAPTISTIQLRGYVVKEDREGVTREYIVITLAQGHIKEEVKTEVTGAEKNKLFPTDIGMVVTDFLCKYFQGIMDYNFTASVEKEFDEIALGKIVWYKMIDHFYKPFHKTVEETIEVSHRKTGERKLGIDPKTGKAVYVRIGKYGPMAQLGESIPTDANTNTKTKSKNKAKSKEKGKEKEKAKIDSDMENIEKPRFAKLRPDQRLETITLEEALGLFELPRSLGEFEGHDMVVAIGRFGPYVRHQASFYSLKKGVDDPYTIQRERAIELILEKRDADSKKVIKLFTETPDVKVLNGRWGPYISYQKNNYKIPKTTDPASLSLEDCLELVEKASNKPKRKGKK